MINAIVLAAGQSKRMGQLKPLLKFKDKTFLEHIISVLKSSAVDTITIVLGAEAETIKKTTDLSGTNIVINKDYQKGQLSSLIAALKNITKDTHAILLCLVDHPFITRDLVNKIIERFKKTNSPIIVPSFNKKRGHPTLFSKTLISELLKAPEDQGARYVLYSNEEKILEADTSERGILIGIDTPDDYRLHFGTNP